MTAKKWRFGLHLAWGLVCLLLGTGSCIVSESRCDANQVRISDNSGLCECVENSVPNSRGYGCDLCGAFEEVRGDKCECKPGYVRGASQACELSTVSTFLQPCSDTAPCTGRYAHCATVGASRFCTNTDCSKNTDCPSDFVCRSEGELRFCGPMLGLGNACAVTGDCGGLEAQYCETLQAKVCIPQGCTSSSACPSGWSCCDLTRFVQTTLCVPSSYLDEGKCIDGSMPVKP